MPPTSSSATRKISVQPDLRHVDTLPRLPTRAALLDRLTERTPTADAAPARSC